MHPEAVQAFFGDQFEDFMAKLEDGGVRLRDFQKWQRETSWPQIRSIDWTRLHRERAHVEQLASEYGLDSEARTLSLTELCEIEAWEEVRDRVRSGDPPRKKETASLLRNSELTLPEDVRAFLADLIENRTGSKRGPRAGSTPFKKPLADRVVSEVQAHRVRRWKRVFQRQKARSRASPDRALAIRDPYRSALSKVSKETGVPQNTLDKWVYPRERRR